MRRVAERRKTKSVLLRRIIAKRSSITFFATYVHWHALIHIGMSSQKENMENKTVWKKHDLCKELGQHWACEYLWKNWYSPSKWRTWARAACDEIPIINFECDCGKSLGYPQATITSKTLLSQTRISDRSNYECVPPKYCTFDRG